MPNYESGSQSAVGNDKNGANTHLMPRQLLGPLENATRYVSSEAASSPSQRSGSKVRASGKMDSFQCTKVLLIPTTVYMIRGQKMNEKKRD